MKCPVCHKKTLTDLGRHQASSRVFVLLMMLQGALSDWRFDCDSCHIHRQGSFSPLEKVASLTIFLCSVPCFVLFFEFLLDRGFFGSILMAAAFVILAFLVYITLYYLLMTRFLEMRVMRYVKKNS